MTNADGGEGLANEILRSIATAYGWPDMRPKERIEIAVEPALQSAYVGRYEVRRGAFMTVFAKDGHLMVEAPPFGPAPVELHAEAEGKYFVTSTTSR